MKKILSFLIIVLLCTQITVYAEPETDAKSVILIEQSTGKVLYENNKKNNLSDSLRNRRPN